jgi:hypothetical protein
MYYDAKVVKCCEIAKYKQYFYLPSAHSVSIIGTPRHQNHRPSCTSALDTDEEMYRLTYTPALVTDAEIKSNEFDTISG